MQVSKYLYKHFAQLNCHNLNYGVKITSAVLLQYVKALGFKVLTLKFYGKPKRIFFYCNLFTNLNRSGIV